ncbi:magnesium transporter NIPA-domain-containing protein [Baffinella frigidus]|nr:magnesium transporter NIPA-domain-containing protein [Cryptophyta sp. CCMP2293]
MAELSAEEQASRDFTTGVIVAICGNLASSISFQVTKLAHMRNTENQPFTKIPMWWLGLLLMIGGEVGNFFAYGWAPATVVSPLGAVAVAANCVLARIVLKEALTLRNLIGVFFAILGATAIAFTAPTSILLENRPSNSTANATLSNSTNSSLSTVEQSVSGEYIYESLVSWRAAGYLPPSTLESVNPTEAKLGGGLTAGETS